jgi:hypothetical protein
MSDTHTRGSNFTPKNFSEPIWDENAELFSKTDMKEGTRVQNVGIQVE